MNSEVRIADGYHLPSTASGPSLGDGGLPYVWQILIVIILRLAVEG